MNLSSIKLLSACPSVMLALNFGAPALEDISVLDFLSRRLRVSFTGDATVWGEGKLLS
jgi:hypothetical protein